jgi:hypothetical protein
VFELLTVICLYLVRPDLQLLQVNELGKPNTDSDQTAL